MLRGCVSEWGVVGCASERVCELEGGCRVSEKGGVDRVC